MRFYTRKNGSLTKMAGRKSARTGKLMNTFGRRLKALRLEQGIALRDFVARLGAAGWEVSEGTWAHVEAGRRILSDTELMMALRVLRRKLQDLE